MKSLILLFLNVSVSYVQVKNVHKESFSVDLLFLFSNNILLFTNKIYLQINHSLRLKLKIFHIKKLIDVLVSKYSQAIQ